jgi:RsiW-degrading membrane proteinase PrsW (M82 family)
LYVKYINFAVSGLAILTMLLCVIRGGAFYRRVAGGEIKRRAAVLLALLIFFFIGYVASPFFYLLEQFEYTKLVVYLVFLFGALFVLLSLNTINAVLKYEDILNESFPADSYTPLNFPGLFP